MEKNSRVELGVTPAADDGKESRILRRGEALSKSAKVVNEVELSKKLQVSSFGGR